MLIVSDLCRAVISRASLLSAAWKLTHFTGFGVVVAGAARKQLPAWSTRLGPLVALLEIFVAVGLLGFPQIWLPSVAAVLFLVRILCLPSQSRFTCEWLRVLAAGPTRELERRTVPYLQCSAHCHGGGRSGQARCDRYWSDAAFAQALSCIGNFQKHGA